MPYYTEEFAGHMADPGETVMPASMPAMGTSGSLELTSYRYVFANHNYIRVAEQIPFSYAVPGPGSIRNRPKAQIVSAGVDLDGAISGD
jgi:hypothetical protein